MISNFIDKGVKKIICFYERFTFRQQDSLSAKSDEDTAEAPSERS